MSNAVFVDLGASNTRYMSSYFKGIRMLPNNMVIAGGTDKVDLLPSDESLESALDVSISKKGKHTYFPCRAIMGDLAQRYSSTCTTPNSLTTKINQPVNNISIILAVAASLYYNEKTEADTEIALYLALPPTEAKSKKQAVKEQFLGEYTVTLNKLDGKEITFTIVDVEVYEESFLALLSFYYGVDMKKKPFADNYSQGYVLSIDIGASTTDLAVVKDKVYLDYTGVTFKLGGNVVRTQVATNIMAEFDGYDIPIEDASNAVIEGRIRVGNNYVDVSHIVAKAKRKYASEICARINQYLTTIAIPIQAIRAVCVSGGGSMASGYVNANGDYQETVAPMTVYITEELQRLCSTVSTEYYDENAREANIRGLFIRGNLDLLQKAKAQQATNKIG